MACSSYVIIRPRRNGAGRALAFYTNVLGFVKKTEFAG
jgi:hypothetical protein